MRITLAFDIIKYMKDQPSPDKIDIWSNVEQVRKFFEERQIEAYLVGGLIRDWLLGRSTVDIDIAIKADALLSAREMADILGGSYVLLDEPNRIARVVLSSSSQKPWYIDISSFAGNIQQDLARRDFTIDAMACNLASFKDSLSPLHLIDPFNAQSDLQQKVIRVVSETSFMADPARLLRAVRLAAELGFTISRETEYYLRRDSHLISGISGERVREELLRILNTSEPGKFIRYLDEMGLLTQIIPELEPARGVTQPREHHWDVLNHSLETVGAIDFLLRKGTWAYVANTVRDVVPWSEKLKEHFAVEVGSGSTHASLLRLAGLLHDISKPETKIIANDRVRFFGHTEQGAEVAAAIMGRLRFSNKEINLVKIIVRYHLRPTQMSHEGMPTQRAIYRYFRDTGTAGIDILFLSLADHLSARGPELDIKEWKNHAEQVSCILEDCYRQESIVNPPKLIDGHDLINLFGLKPGPQIRGILEAVKEAQADGEITSREDALSYVQNRLL